MNAEMIFDARAALGEGALWHDRRLLWVDIEGCSVNRFDPVTRRNESWHLGQRVGTVVPRAAGGFVVGVQHGVGFLDPATGKLEVFANPEAGRPHMRFNDGKCDPRGRLFAGTMALEKPREAGSLYRIDPDRTVTRVISGTGTSNGLAWNHDATVMYYIDTPTLEVSAFDYDASTGSITHRRTAVRFSTDLGRPDGMTIDAAGNLWVAMYGGGRVLGCDPRTGKIFEQIDVAASRTTSCAFGGPNLDDLFITSAGGDSSNRGDNERYAGAICVARPGVQGVPAFAFAG